MLGIQGIEIDNLQDNSNKICKYQILRENKVKIVILTPTKVTSISIAFMISYFLVVDKREWSDIR